MTTARPARSEKSRPSLTLPRHTAKKMAAARGGVLQLLGVVIRCRRELAARLQKHWLHETAEERLRVKPMLWLSVSGEVQAFQSIGF